MYALADILAKVRSYLPYVDLTPIERAYAYAEKAHEGQKRLSGVPYIQHPLAVADLVATLRLDVPSVCAALLHDVREDAPDRSQDLEDRFGREVALIVEGVTKLQRYQFTSRIEKQAENFKKMLVAMAQDIRVLLVKLCDRLNNMRELEYLSAEKQREISEETLTIYAPLAERLGIAWIRAELEDLSFRFLWPDDYENLKRQADARLKERRGFIRRVVEEISELLERHGLRGFEVTGRPKHLFGIYQKMRRQEVDLAHVYDFVAFRVIVREVPECWLVLGYLHDRWTPIPARFKDHINVPKPNGYQSLHTTVFGPGGEPMEIQIRTWEMHRVAESGIAAHWSYKEGGKVVLRDQERFNWLRQLIEWAQEVRNPAQFWETVQESLFTEQVYVFTPKGDLVVLPRGATPVDFAYEIHTEVGHRCQGAKVNNRLVPLNTRLRSGDMVEIITSKHGTPKRDWLEFVVSAKAHNKIRAFFQAQERAHALELGRHLLEREFRRRGLTLKAVLEDEATLRRLLERTRCSSEEELLREVGFGKIKVQDVVAEVAPAKVEEPKQREPGLLREVLRRRPKGIEVDGVEDVLMHLAKCCNPIPGDKIVAFVTRGRGVTIHAAACETLRSVDPERLLQAHWMKGTEGLFDVPISAKCIDEPGVLARVTKEIGDRKANIASVYTRPLGDHVTEVRMVLQVEDLSQLEAILRALRRVKGVVNVERLRQA